VSGLAAVLRISENQIVIVSVTEGSVIVELGFVRLGGVHPSPADVVLRLKSAAASGELEQLGVTELSVGQEVVFTTSSETSVDVGVAVGASVGGVMFVVLLAAAIWKFRQRGNKISPDEDKRTQELHSESIVDVPVPSLHFSTT
jgi:hypothetical protein